LALARKHGILTSGSKDTLAERRNRMLAKMTSKHQITIPKRVLQQAGLDHETKLHFDVRVERNAILLKPVTVTIEEHIPPAHMAKCERWATTPAPGDARVETPAAAPPFLTRRRKAS